MYVIECRGGVELFKDSCMAARPGSMTIIASETDPSDWHGSLTLDNPLDERLARSLKAGGTFVVAFDYDGRSLLGIIVLMEPPKDIGPFSWVEFRGEDIFHLR